MERTVIYARVSTDGQTNENQIMALKKIAEDRKWEIIKIYEDHGFSGKTGREDRLQLNQLLQDARRRKFDRVLFWSVDRLARSTAKAAEFMTELSDCGVLQFYYQQGVDAGTHYGKAMISMAAVFAELEDAIIRERIHAGMARARAEGKRIGRAGMDQSTIDLVLRLKLANPEMSQRKIAAKVKISLGKVNNILKENYGNK